MKTIGISAVILSLFLTGTVSAQLIAIKTVPLATGDQFLIYPSQYMGMGDVSIAWDDSLLDPFINPAKGARNKTTLFAISPVYYNIADDNGSALTAPFSALFRYGDWFGTLSACMQELQLSGFNSGLAGLTIPLSDRKATNFYTFASLGKEFLDSRLAFAGAIGWSKLHAMDGVELLYANSRGLKQNGKTFDLRMGFLADLEHHSLEALVLYNRLDMTHNVTYRDWRPDLVYGSVPFDRVEKNLDYTRTWGLSLGYMFRLPEKGWNLGAIFTANKKSHPKIPNYSLMQIPRDPGTSNAYNFGFGFARTFADRATFAMDFIYEPIWSYTWADAIEPVTTRSGGTIAPGNITVENDFWFSNKIFRLGFNKVNKRVDFQMGLQIHYIGYRLKQYDHVAERFRMQRENWFEWSPSLGFVFKLEYIQIRYMARLIFGTGRPGVAGFGVRPTWGWRGSTGEDSFALSQRGNADFLLAPSGALTLVDTRVLTHQITVSMPLFD